MIEGGNEMEMRRNRNGNGGGNEMEMRWNGGNDHSRPPYVWQVEACACGFGDRSFQPAGEGLRNRLYNAIYVHNLCRHLHTHNTQLYPGQLQAEAILQAGGTVVKIHGGGFATDAYSSYNLVYIGNIRCQVN